MLHSRNIPAEKFLKEFCETLMPGVIPRSQFIQWPTIERKIKTYNDAVDFFVGIQGLKGQKLVQELADCLQSADQPIEILKGAFELLGHTGNNFVSKEDAIEIKRLAENIKTDGEVVAKRTAQLFCDLGLGKILESGDLKSVFLGVQVGLETHRRKNVGGKAFNVMVEDFLNKMIKELEHFKLDIKLEPEYKIYYKDGKTSKSVDFGLLVEGKPPVGIEVNFYTGTGSKPTEIKRSYADVNRHLEEVGADLVWITDGNGYHKMRKSLREAFEAHPNTYNLAMAKKHLKGDLLKKFF